MSVVTVQLGQCGNQVGLDLFDTLYNDAQAGQKKSYATASYERFFHQTKDGDLVARAVLIDMEPKVIKQNFSKTAKSGVWKYDSASSFSQSQGSGNNWANGFCIHGPRHREVMEDLIRREVERCDKLTGFMAMMSVAGGTGSGVGTYVTQCLRDVYPKSFIVNHLIWPYETGEVTVQDYNSVLTLGHIYQLSDGILVHENDMVNKICSQLLHISDISIADLNKVIAHQLGAIFQPVFTADSDGHYSRNFLGEFVSALACHPEYKLLSMSTVPQMPSSYIPYTTFEWPSLIKHLRRMLISNTRMEEVTGSTQSLTGSNLNTSLANLLILRGKDVFTANTGDFSETSLYTSWQSPKDAFNVWKCPVPFRKYEKMAMLVSNSQALIEPLDNTLRKAWSMFAARAYVYQYTRFGMSEEDLLESFTFAEQIVSSYSQLGCKG
ncbi:tubulin delta chain isoform X1 [Corythoichthys intestinalis]|uniref:tubulin delta chain isoform X1 n=2 Tax=Corythoichthys intestinalis TaxID=161448 RepID=UPI0025A52ABE|nr:tubulin delta chain isoform X1 [Corythoichthys intestinalis]